MGLCVSVARSECDSSLTAKIVTVNGDLREYDVPVLASQVLEAESLASSSSSSSSRPSSSSSSSSRPSSYFLCNSDSLYYDDFIPAIESEEILQADQIYFVLPISKRQYRLTASDMAALAVKASVAIEKAAGKKNRRRRSGRISPVMMLNQPNDRIVAVNKTAGETVMQKGKLPNRTTPFKTTTTSGYSRSGSVRKLKRYASGRAKLAARSIKRLSTIYEGTVF